MRAALLALGIAMLSAGAQAQQELSTGPGSIFAGVTRGGVTTAVINPGLITIAGKTVTVAVASLKAGDAVVVTPYSGALGLGVGIGAARVPTDGNLEINLIATVAIGVTVSSITVQVLYFGP